MEGINLFYIGRLLEYLPSPLISGVSEGSMTMLHEGGNSQSLKRNTEKGLPAAHGLQPAAFATKFNNISKLRPIQFR